MSVMQLLFGGQQAASTIPETIGSPITVTAPPDEFPRDESRAPSYDSPAPRQEIRPEYVLNDPRQPPHESELEEIIPRKGMFGTKGTLRDVLGAIGDAFLVQSGNRPMYAPQRQREKMGDALYGFSQNPVQAIERLAAAGYADQAAALMQRYQANQDSQAQQDLNERKAAITATKNDRAYEEDRFERMGIFRSKMASMLRGTDDESRPQVWDIIEKLSDRQGFSLEEMGLSRDLTPAQVDAIIRGEVEVGDQIDDERNQYNSETNRINATRPRAAPRPRAVTNASMIDRIRQKKNRGEALSPGDQALWNRHIDGTRRSGRGTLDEFRDIATAGEQ